MKLSLRRLKGDSFGAFFNVQFANQQFSNIKSILSSLGCGMGTPLTGEMEGALNLEILTPEKKIFSGEVYGVQMPGISGSFEVLENHAPIVSALKPGPLKILKDKQNHVAKYKIQSGFVEVLNNHVTVMVEGAVAVK